MTLVLCRILVMIQIVVVQFCFVKTKIFLSFLLQKFLYNSLCYKKETVFSSQFYVHLWLMPIALSVDFLFRQRFFFITKSPDEALSMSLISLLLSRRALRYTWEDSSLLLPCCASGTLSEPVNCWCLWLHTHTVVPFRAVFHAALSSPQPISTRNQSHCMEYV